MLALYRAPGCAEGRGDRPLKPLREVGNLALLRRSRIYRAVGAMANAVGAQPPRSGNFRHEIGAASVREMAVKDGGWACRWR